MIIKVNHPQAKDFWVSLNQIYENDSNELIKIVGDLWIAWTYDSKHTNEEFFKHFNNCRNKRLRLKIINEIKNREKEIKIFNEKLGS